jgi:hypothetical protein
MRRFIYFHADSGQTKRLYSMAVIRLHETHGNTLTAEKFIPPIEVTGPMKRFLQRRHGLDMSWNIK